MINLNPMITDSQKNYRKNNHERVREIERRYFEKNREERLRKMREYHAKLKTMVFEAYGHKCACCGEEKREFLCIDHKNGGGTKERKLLGSRPLLRQIVKGNFPKEKYQLLCHNCNMSMGFYGYCPHRPEIKRPIFSGKQTQHTNQSFS